MNLTWKAFAVSEQKLICITQKTVMFELFLTFSKFLQKNVQRKKKNSTSAKKDIFLMSNISKGFKYKNLTY